MKKYGFVYIWRDRKKDRYYVGSHWGSEDDRYICSSDSMRDAYKRRPTDFKRRILKSNISEYHLLIKEESSWLSLIKPEEFGKRYYNKLNNCSGKGISTNWTAGKKWYNNGIKEERFFENEQPSDWISGRLKPSKEVWNKGKKLGKKWYNNGIKEYQYTKGQQPKEWILGRLSASIQKTSSKNLGQKRSDEAKNNMRTAQLNLYASGYQNPRGMLGKKHSDSSLKKKSISMKNYYTPEMRQEKSSIMKIKHKPIVFTSIIRTKMSIAKNKNINTSRIS